MKISKIFAIASAAVLIVACGTPAAEGSKEVKALLPSKSLTDSTSYLIGVNFGSWIKGNNFGDINFTLDRVIKGWSEGMKLVGEGGKVQLVIPGELAYGEYGNRGIEPNSTLVFDVTLNKVGTFVEREEK